MFQKKKISLARKLLSLALSVLLLVSVFGVCSFMLPVMAETTDYVGTINGTEWCFLGQWVWLDAETEYVAFYEYTDNYGRYISVFGNSENKAVLPRIPVSIDSEYKTSAVKFTTPAVGTDGLTWENGKCQVWVGLQNDTQVSAQKYYRNFCLYAIEDSEKTNLLADTDFQSNGNALDGSIWQNPYREACGTGVGKATLAQAGGDDAFKKPEYVGTISGIEWCHLGQWVWLDAETEYIASYEYTDSYGRYIGVLGIDENKTAIPCSPVSIDSKYNTNAIKFTTPAVGTSGLTWDSYGRCEVWVGIINDTEVSTQKYYRNLRLYKTSDPMQLNLFADANFCIGGNKLYNDYWLNPYHNACGTGVGKATLAQAGGDEAFLKPEYVGTISGIEWCHLGQWVWLDAETEYIASYEYTDSYGRYIGVLGIDENKTAIPCSPVSIDSKYNTNAIKFTTPAVGTSGLTWDSYGRCEVWVGIINDTEVSTQKYYRNLRLYKTSDPMQLNLFADANFCIGGNKLYNDYWLNPYHNACGAGVGKATLAQAGGDDAFKKPAYVGMINSTGWCHLGQWVWLDAETEYVFSYEYSGEPGFIRVFGNGENNSIFPDSQMISVSSVYKTYAVKFTTPAVGTDELTWDNGKCQVWVGIDNNSSASAKKYYRNFRLYQTSDDLQNNLIADEDFSNNQYNLDGEIWKNPYRSACGTGVGKATLVSAGGDRAFARMGDANGDGVCDIRDLIRTKRCLAGITEYVISMDLDGSNGININDLVEMRKSLLVG